MADKFWRIDDLRTDSVIVVKAENRDAALEQFLETCADNTLIAEADEADYANGGGE